MSFALIGLGRFDEAVVAAKKAIRKNHNSSRIYLCLAAALAQLGREARGEGNGSPPA
jgi:adenylate cyclase